jgi:acetyltransferase-like isoleucine patch superfamily enzyme
MSVARATLNRMAGLGAAWAAWRARAMGVALGAAPRLARRIDFQLGLRDGRFGDIRIGDHAWIEQGVVLHAFGGQIKLGEHVFLGPYAVVYGHGGVEVGDHTLISMHCCILSSNHSRPPLGQSIRDHPDILLPTRIGRDVWLGAGVKVLGGITIGDGCVVGAGAVVTADLPPGSIAMGVPARVVGERH